MAKKFKKGDRIIIKAENGFYGNMVAEVKEVFKDTYKVVIRGVDSRNFRIISNDQILRKL